MPSLLPGFEYDIFISYRQKDNKYDRWVTDFVNNLKRELEATFKEEVTVYFDENQHDGLLETHNVDKSLEGKLKSLVFIPIVSQTYCDVKSFAWLQEFLAFNKLARADAFGMDIRLEKGNVASRVLPVRIHDLAAHDKLLLENELAGVLRPIDFIYRSSGVNRPLRANEDNAGSNLSKVFYRDQINKVANSVKEIINGMVIQQAPLKTLDKSQPTLIHSRKKDKKKIWYVVAALVAIMLVSVGYYGINSLQRKREVNAIREGTIAILPFENQTGHAEFNAIGQVAADFISTQLLQHQFWKVVPTQEVFRKTVYSGLLTNPEAEKKLADQGLADYLVIGHYNLIGDTILLVVSVNDVNNNNVLYTTPVIKSAASAPMSAVTDAQQFILGFLSYSRNEQINAVHTPRYDAYQSYLKGMELFTKSNIGPGNIVVRINAEIDNYFLKSISQDPDFMAPYFRLADLYIIDRRAMKMDSLLMIIEEKKTLLSDNEKLDFDIRRLTQARDWDALEKLYLSKVDASRRELRPYYQLGVIACLKQNRPKKALEYFEKVDLSEFDFENKAADQFYYAMKAHALLRLRRFRESADLLGNLPFKPITPVLLKRWTALYFARDTVPIEREIAEYLKTAVPTADPGIPSIGLFRAAMIESDTVFMRRRHQEFGKFILGWDSQTLSGTIYYFVQAVMRFRMNDNMEAAERAFLDEKLPRIPRQRRIHQLGILYAVTGRKEKAEQVVQDLLAHENKFDNGLTRYYSAKIFLALGRKDESIRYLKESLERGMDFGDDVFEFDGDFKDLIGYPAFTALVSPKE